MRSSSAAWPKEPSLATASKTCKDRSEGNSPADTLSFSNAVIRRREPTSMPYSQRNSIFRKWALAVRVYKMKIASQVYELAVGWRLTQPLDELYHGQPERLGRRRRLRHESAFNLAPDSQVSHILPCGGIELDRPSQIETSPRGDAPRFRPPRFHLTKGVQASS